MSDEQKQVYESIFHKPFDEITEEEIKAFNESIQGRVEKLKAALKPVIEFFKNLAKRVLAFWQNLRKRLGKAAENGDLDAQYVLLKLDVGRLEGELEAVNKKLSYTRKSTARKPLLTQQAVLWERLIEKKNELEDVVDLMNEREGKKSYDAR